MAKSAAKHLEDFYFLYQIRNLNTSGGLGFDGYHGITDNPKRRQREHFNALKTGTHPNRKLQKAFNDNPHGWHFHVAYRGSKEDCEARERLLVPKPNHHLNQQRGGGRNRGMSEEDAIWRAYGRKNGRPTPGSEKVGRGSKAANDASGAERNENVDADTRKRTSRRSGDKAAKATVGAGSSVLVAEVAAAAGLAATLIAAGAGTAYAMNKTVLKDDESLGRVERQSRALGRKASVAGGILGGGGTAVAIIAGGEVVGLTGGGLAAGLTALGGSVGIGAVVAVAIPVVAAVAAGGAIYSLTRWFKSKR